MATPSMGGAVTGDEGGTECGEARWATVGEDRAIAVRQTPAPSLPLPRFDTGKEGRSGAAGVTGLVEFLTVTPGKRPLVDRTLGEEY